MKKSIVISLLTVTILFCTAIYSLASTGIVTTDTLRLRKDASIDASILALLSMDDEIEVLEEKNGWYRVKATVNGKEYEGYVSKDYVTIKEDTLNKDNETSTQDKPEENNENEEQINEEQTNGEEQENQNENSENKVKVKTLVAGTKLYITPAINSLDLATLEEEKIIEITSEVNGWTYVTAGNNKGWVRTDNIVEKEVSESELNTSSQKTGYISGSSVNFRQEANSSSKSMLKLKRNAKVTILGTENGWTKIQYDGKTGYVSSQYVSDKKVETTSRSGSRTTKKTTTTNKTTTTKTKSTQTVANTSSNKEETATVKQNVSGSEIVAYAKKYLGYKYVYGGSSPSGFDCSGFTSYVYKHFGYSLSRSSSAQGSNGKAVSKSDLKEGDIICFARSSGSKKIGHVGIYIGGGKFIHAANSRKGVIISNVDGAGYYYVCARRILN